MADSASGGTTFLNAATTLKAFGRAKEALPYYEQTMRAYGQSLDPGDYRFGGLFNNMALAFEDLGEYPRAEAYYRKAMDIMERLKPGSILEIAVTWVNLAVLYEKWDHEDEIDGCLQKAIEGFHSEEVLRDGYYAFNCANARIPSAILDISASGRSFRGRLRRSMGRSQAGGG